MSNEEITVLYNNVNNIEKKPQDPHVALEDRFIDIANSIERKIKRGVWVSSDVALLSAVGAATILTIKAITTKRSTRSNHDGE